MPLIVGTSGWQYKHWGRSFYPPDVPQRRWLEFYATQFASVENDGTFYRLPTRETFATWRARTPDGFIMAIKASRYLTHVKRLNDPAGPVAKLVEAAAGLGPRLGPVLLQLPPTLQADAPRLAACLAEFGRAASPSGRGPIQVAVEPRHPSWWTDETRQVLAAHNAALCWADRKAEPVTPLWRTADWGYIRFHEGVAYPWPAYGRAELRRWLGRLRETWPDDEASVYAYFNNDQAGAALTDAEALIALAREKGYAVAEPSAPTLGMAPGDRATD
ncbi:MAG TPA: DUF72 domain-containing protein [Streptosporangiaceae bacterium]|jgi:uncharacterized protein YecE (DUF72 family)|nr:DUF72 domain-containing protein [Streptosporangiaceae bacterium]